MKFAFLVHPLSEETKAWLNMDKGHSAGKIWSSCGNLLEFCDSLSQSMGSRVISDEVTPQVRVIDELKGLVSHTGQECEGRLYEIPMHVNEILDDPSTAVEYMEQAVDAAAQWGASLVGLGSMTGVVGGQGSMLADRGPVPVTTGNSLTAYAALQTLENACREAELNIEDEVIAVVGIPGSIAAVVARLLRPKCRGMILVARRNSTRAKRLKEELDADLVLDIPTALSKASIIVSATSTGGCIKQSDLRSGAVVIDIGVPADVEGTRTQRDDILILSGGLALAPSTMPRDSMWLGFHHGMVPCCLGETMTLALEGRAECYTIGRDLSPDAVLDIGEIAHRHGFDFSPLVSFGLPVQDSTLTAYKKALFRRGRVRLTNVATLDHRATSAASQNGSHSDSNGSTEHSQENGHSNGYSNGHSNGYSATEAMSFDHGDHDTGISNPESSQENGTAHTAQSSEQHAPPKSNSLADRAEILHARHINPVMVAISGKSGFIRTFVRGEGCYVWDREGNRYLDFVSGFGSMNLGHNHPRVTIAIQDAMASQAVGYAQTAINPYAAALAERLAALSPPGLEMTFFTNSGTESVEAALKTARLATGRTRFLYCHRSYHGKTLGSLSVTGNDAYQKPFAPLLSDCDAIDYGDLDALERRLRDAPYAAFILEPLQGEGGMVVPPAGYLNEVAKLCRAHGTLLIVDEVQTGLGRTGHLFACDKDSVTPDIITLAKSLGGGMMPIGAMLSRRDVWQRAYGSVKNFALLSSTFAGGSLACAAAMAALDVTVEDGLAENAAARGQQLVRELRQVQKEAHTMIAEVRGEGLMVGIEMHPLPESIAAHWRQADPTGMMKYLVLDFDRHVSEVPALYVMQTLLKRNGIYTQIARSRGNVLRVQPPLTIKAQEITTFVQALRGACLELQASNGLVDAIISKSISGIHEASKSQPGNSGAVADPVAIEFPESISRESAIRKPR